MSEDDETQSNRSSSVVKTGSFSLKRPPVYSTDVGGDTPRESTTVDDDEELYGEMKSTTVDDDDDEDEGEMNPILKYVTTFANACGKTESFFIKPGFDVVRDGRINANVAEKYLMKKTNLYGPSYAAWVDVMNWRSKDHKSYLPRCNTMGDVVVNDNDAFVVAFADYAAKKWLLNRIPASITTKDVASIAFANVTDAIIALKRTGDDNSYAYLDGNYPNGFV